MTAPEQPAGGPEPSRSLSPSESAAQRSPQHANAMTADSATSASPHPKKQEATTVSAASTENGSDKLAPNTPPAQADGQILAQPAAPAAHDSVNHADPSSQHEAVFTLPVGSKQFKNKPTAGDMSSQFLTPERSSYVDPTPATPVTSQPSSRSPSNAARSHRSNESSPARSGPENDDKQYVSEDDHDNGSRSEIQSIMEQFSESGGGPGAEEVMSPRLEIASPLFTTGQLQHQHPPRGSSLESSSHDANVVAPSAPSCTKDESSAEGGQGPPVPPKDASSGTASRNQPGHGSTSLVPPASPQLSMHRLPPPEPEPEPALPFDFHRFLEQLRNKKADPVARYLKSFLAEFAKRQWMVHEQVKIISDFLAFIANKMVLSEVWRDVSDAEFDNAREGMEKLVMNRLYSQTFSPAIPSPRPVPGAKPKRRGGEVPLGPGRRGQHQEDVERDEIVTQKINIYSWVKPEHLDIPQIGDSGRRFLKLAQQELLKIKSYRAPRDKIICVLNCCKVIFGLLKHNKSDSSADSFMPLLIYVVLQSNPEHSVSNVQYILRFRNQERLGGEAGYYLSSLMGAIQFIENMDRTSLTISDDEFEKCVEAAVSAIAERNQTLSPTIRQQTKSDEKSSGHWMSTDGPGYTTSAGAGAGGASSSSSALQRFDAAETTEAGEGGAHMSGLLRTFQRPLTTIGRMFSDETVSAASPLSSSSSLRGGSGGGSGGSVRQSLRVRPRNLATFSRHGGGGGDGSHEEVGASVRQQNQQQQQQQQKTPTSHALSAEEAAARQASAETAEAQRRQRAEHVNVVDTLAGMFPDLDKDIISDVVYQKEGRVGLAVDACLALST